MNAVDRWRALPPKRRRDMVETLRDDARGLFDLAKERAGDRPATLRQAETVRLAADALEELGG